MTFELQVLLSSFRCLVMGQGCSVDYLIFTLDGYGQWMYISVILHGIRARFKSESVRSVVRSVLAESNQNGLSSGR